MGDAEVKVEVVQRTLEILTDSKQIYTDGGFYYFKGRGNILEIRKEREKWSKQKWIIVQNTANKLKIIPFIKTIGVTGALSMNNCKENDDIDLIIISATNSLWLTRLLIILFSPFLGIKRRKPKEKNVKDKICFNLFLDEAYLRIQPENLFLAHEICQVKPIFDRGNSYEKFLWENRWVSNFLPNAKNSSKFNPPAGVQSSKLESKHPISQYLNILISFLDIIAFNLQYAYMKPKITCEKVSLHQAFFHPKNLGDEIQKEFERRIKGLVF